MSHISAGRRVEFHEFFPVDSPIVPAVFAGEGLREHVDSLGVGLLKFIVFFFSFMSQWFDDFCVKFCIPGDEFPESLTAVLEIVPFIGIGALSVATAVDRNNLQAGITGTKRFGGCSEV